MYSKNKNKMWKEGICGSYGKDKDFLITNVLEYKGCKEGRGNMRTRFYFSYSINFKYCKTIMLRKMSFDMSS